MSRNGSRRISRCSRSPCRIRPAPIHLQHGHGSVPLAKSGGSRIDIDHPSFTFSQLEKEVGRLESSRKMDFPHRRRWARHEYSLRIIVRCLLNRTSSLKLTLLLFSWYVPFVKLCHGFWAHIYLVMLIRIPVAIQRIGLPGCRSWPHPGPTLHRRNPRRQNLQCRNYSTTNSSLRAVGSSALIHPNMDLDSSNTSTMTAPKPTPPLPPGLRADMTRQPSLPTNPVCVRLAVYAGPWTAGFRAALHVCPAPRRCGFHRRRRDP